MKRSHSHHEATRTVATRGAPVVVAVAAQMRQIGHFERQTANKDLMASVSSGHKEGRSVGRMLTLCVMVGEKEEI